MQKTILESQKVSEMESMELQEFLQAEKSTLSDSLRDTEVEVINFVFVKSTQPKKKLCQLILSKLSRLSHR